MNQEKKKNGGCLKSFIIGFFILWVSIAGIILISIIATPIAHLNRNEYTVQVTDKAVKRDGDSDIYLVFGQVQDEDGSTETRTFTIQDSLLEGKFRTSDVYGSLQIGQTYVVKTYGWRIPILSAYENIIGVKEINSN